MAESVSARDLGAMMNLVHDGYARRANAGLPAAVVAGCHGWCALRADACGVEARLQKLNGRGLCLPDHTRHACVIRVAGGSTPEI